MEREWTWDIRSNLGEAKINFDGSEVVLNDQLSIGRSFACSSESLTRDHHYWQVEIVSGCFGQSTSIGVVSHPLSLPQLFPHALYTPPAVPEGYESWRWTHYGTLIHDRRTLPQAFVPHCPMKEGFCDGCVIDVHLDRIRGTLSYRKNGVPLGIAFTGLASKLTFAVVTSMATNCVLRLRFARSYSESLQLLSCLAAPMKHLWCDRLTFPPQLWRKLTTEYPWLNNGGYAKFPFSSKRTAFKRNTTSSKFSRHAKRLRIVGSNDDLHSSDDSSSRSVSPLPIPPILANFTDLNSEMPGNIPEWPRLDRVDNS